MLTLHKTGQSWDYFAAKARWGHMLSTQAVQHGAATSGADLRELVLLGVTGKIPTRNLGEISLVKGVP